MLKNIKYVILIIVMLFSLFYLYVFKNNQYITESFLDSTLIQDIILVDLTIDKEVDHIEYSMAFNEIEFDKLTKRYNSLLEELKFKNNLIYETKDFQDTKTLIDSKFQLVNKIKDLNTILKNTMQSLTPLIDFIYKNPYADRELIVNVGYLLANITHITESYDEAITNSILRTLDKLYSNDNTLNEKLELLQKSFALILVSIPKQRKNIKELETIKSKEALDNILNLLEQLRNDVRKSSHAFEFLSFALIVLMTIGIFLFSKREELYYKSFIRSLKTDYLTGDKNRDTFIKDINKKIDLENSLIVSFDINKFRFINDRYGIDEADELLLYVSKELKKLFGDENLYRVSSNTFNIILPNSYNFDGLNQKIKEIVNLANIDFDFSIAIYYTHKNDTYKTIHTNLQATIYSAKRKTANKIFKYNIDDKDIFYYKNLSQNALIERDRILKAIKEDRFIIFYQPIYDIKSDKIFKYESLVRLKEGDNILPPFKFIRVAEEFNLISDITKIVIKKVFLMAKQRDDIAFSINLSGKDLNDKTLIAYIKNLQGELSLNSHNITFEITETEALQDMKESIEFINILKMHGFKFAIDDFGIGESSLRYLRDLPVDYIKIDGSFIKNIESELNDREFVKLINQVIKLYGKKSIAEFVENGKILSILDDLNIDYAQGYHIGKPEPALVN